MARLLDVPQLGFGDGQWKCCSKHLHQEKPLDAYSKVHSILCTHTRAQQPENSNSTHKRSLCCRDCFGSITKVVWENAVDTDATMHTVTQTGLTKVQVTWTDI